MYRTALSSMIRLHMLSTCCAGAEHGKEDAAYFESLSVFVSKVRGERLQPGSRRGT